MLRAQAISFSDVGSGTPFKSIKVAQGCDSKALNVRIETRQFLEKETRLCPEVQNPEGDECGKGLSGGCRAASEAGWVSLVGRP